MLIDKKAFSSFSVNDIDKAKEFYQGTLGLIANTIEMGGDYRVLELDVPAVPR